MEPTPLDITPDEYFARPEISNGCLRCYMTDGPLICYHQFIKRDMESKSSDAKEFGRSFHAAVADPDSFLGFYATIPDTIEADSAAESVRSALLASGSKADFQVGDEINRKKSAHRQYIELHQQMALQNGLDYVTESDLETIRRMIEAIHENAAAREYVLLSGQHNTEVAYVNQDRVTGLGIKALVDLDLGPVLVDYKTTRHTRPHDFLRDIMKSYKYQAEWYLRVTGAEKMVFIGVTKSPPHECFVQSITRKELTSPNSYLSAVIQGTPCSVQHANDVALQALKSSMDFNEWHNSGHGAELEIGSEVFKELAI